MNSITSFDNYNHNKELTGGRRSKQTTPYISPVSSTNREAVPNSLTESTGVISIRCQKNAKGEKNVENQ